MLIEKEVLWIKEKLKESSRELWLVQEFELDCFSLLDF